jgi:hypothetical protein
MTQRDKQQLVAEVYVLSLAPWPLVVCQATLSTVATSCERAGRRARPSTRHQADEVSLFPVCSNILSRLQHPNIVGFIERVRFCPCLFDYPSAPRPCPNRAIAPFS